MPKQVILWIFRALAAVIALYCIVAMARVTYGQGQDFEVFWYAAQALWRGDSIYQDFHVRDFAGMYFKYPPWVATLFLPFAPLPWEWAKWSWAGVEILSLGVILERTRALTGATWAMTGLCAFFFWPIWFTHAMDGQVSLPMLAVALVAYSTATLKTLSPLREWVLLTALSVKITSVVGLVGTLNENRAQKIRWPRAIGCALLTWTLLSVPALRGVGSPVDLIKSWAHATTSGAEALGDDKTYGHENQGVPAMVLRAFRSRGWDSPIPYVPRDLAATAFSITLLAPLIAFAFRRKRGTSERISEDSRWAIGLACIPLVHPLAWYHLFVFAFPVFVLSTRTELQVKAPHRLALWALAAALLVALTRSTLHASIALPVLALSVKSWGVTLLFVLIATAPALKRSR